MHQLLLLYQAHLLLYHQLGTHSLPFLLLASHRLLVLVPYLFQSTMFLVRRALCHLLVFQGPCLVRGIHSFLPQLQLPNPLVQMMSMWRPKILDFLFLPTS